MIIKVGKKPEQIPLEARLSGKALEGARAKYAAMDKAKTVAALEARVALMEQMLGLR